ncbi:sulfatase [Pelagicoccus enzymogenes]|uniref:sulfatase family protein n=1 Tax=Pelagicoccus enzymogenes TaxID=2773457 RepID=UPI00280DD7C5|nr:sulfatase [Pelagicoccus enzymogenes]MDQ8198000.1 sulfatase [Pelagicoccus enzymogenes]
MRHLSLFTLLSILATAHLFATARELNLMLILADDMTYSDASVYGGQAATPHMERLAAQGMRFDNCFQAAPMCSPTRHTLYTGLYPVRSGAWPNHTFLYPEIETFANFLQDAGYRAGFSGKTHIQPLTSFPFEFLSVKAKNKNPDFGQVDRFLGDCADGKTPFGLILCSNEPHTPWTRGDASAYPPHEIELPPTLVDTPSTRSDFSKYLAEITYFDSQVGQALELLEKHGLADNTLVIVLTEQGSAFPFAKWTCYDAGLGSGLIVRWPGQIRPGSVSKALVEYTDIIPTFFEAAGLPVPPNLDGSSFASVLSGKKQSHKQHVYGLQTSVGIHNGPGHYGIRSVRDERYRYILNLSPERVFSNWATKSDWWKEWTAAADAGNPFAKRAVERYTKRPAAELYDCINDPWNLNNLADVSTYADKKAELAAKLDDWMKEQGDQGVATELAAEDRLWKNAYQWKPLLDKELSKWELWLGVPHPSVSGLPDGTPTAPRPQDGVPLGLGNDPKNVFSVIEENGTPVLKITGEIYGGLTTLEAYQNYHFSAEVKWGEK